MPPPPLYERDSGLPLDALERADRDVFPGVRTVTIPGLFGCLMCWCDPLVRTRILLSALRTRMTSGRRHSDNVQPIGCTSSHRRRLATRLSRRRKNGAPLERTDVRSAKVGTPDATRNAFFPTMRCSPADDLCTHRAKSVGSQTGSELDESRDSHSVR